ncbi:MAG: hypothetical protein HS113_06045 [Verrucomicrobiales bacterium]|nr:hypothetical protein [Verrucomicrobiales bacterium]
MKIIKHPGRWRGHRLGAMLAVTLLAFGVAAPQAQAALAAPELKAPAHNSHNLPVRITLDWKRVPTATGYDWQVRYAGNVVRNGQTAGLYATTAEVRMDDNKTYEWRVRARAGNATGPWSGWWSFATAPKAPPAAPRLTSPESNSANVGTWRETDRQVAVAFVWSAVAGAAEYQLQIASNSQFTSAPTTRCTATSYTSGLPPATTHYARVAALVDGQRSAWSAVIQFTTAKAPAPAAPTLKAPANNARNVPVQITLEWNSVPTATAYDWQVRRDGAVVREGQTTGRDATSAAVRMDNDKTFEWRVRARTDYAIGSWSAAWQFTTETKTPAAPILKSPANNAVNLPVQITLAWEPVSGATGYDWEVLLAGQVVRNGQTASRDATTAAVRMDDNKTYTWRVRARAGSLTSPWSAVWKFTTPPKPLAAPTLKSPANNAVNLPVQITLAWDPVNSATGYDWEVLHGGAVVRDGQTASRVATTVGVMLDYGQTYTWRVRARAGSLTSPWSAEWKFTTKPKSPPSTIRLTTPQNGASNVGELRADGSVTVRFEWASVNGAATYELQIATNDKFTSPVVVKTGSSTAERNLMRATTYYARVASITSDVLLAWSPTNRFVTVSGGGPVDPPPVGPVSAPKILWPKDGATNVDVGDPAKASATRFSWERVGATPIEFVVEIYAGKTLNPAQMIERKSVAGTQTTYTKLLEPLRQYVWRVAAVDANGKHHWSGTAAFSTEGYQVPITQLEWLSQGIRIGWTPHRSAVSYEVEVTAFYPFQPPPLTPPTVTKTYQTAGTTLQVSHAEFRLPNGTLPSGYTVRVRARADVIGPWSPPRSIYKLPGPITRVGD